MKYFAENLTKEALQTEYRKLVKKYHPDRNSDSEAGKIMAEINEEYDQYFVRIQKKTIGFDWDDIFARYAEAQKSREAILRFLNFDKQAGTGWFTQCKTDNLLWGPVTLKYVSDNSSSWDNFHGGFALTQDLAPEWESGSHKMKRIPARIECPTIQDMYFAMIGQTRNAKATEVETTDNITKAAYVSMFGDYKHIRTKKNGEMWIESDRAFMKVSKWCLNAPRYLFVAL